MKTTLFILFSLFFLTGNFSVPSFDNNKKPFSERALQPSSSDTLIKMERTICFGFCPAYELIIQKNGKITFTGKEHVAHKGMAEGEMSQEHIEKLTRILRESHFMKIPSKPECKTRMTDHPSVFLTIELDGKRHSITHYHGCKGFEHEDELYDLEEKIDSLAGVDRWVEE